MQVKIYESGICWSYRKRKVAKNESRVGNLENEPGRAKEEGRPTEKMRREERINRSIID